MFDEKAHDSGEETFLNHGPYPNLNDLADFDPRHAIDFRRIYATLLDGWLDCSSEKVLGQKFEALSLV